MNHSATIPRILLIGHDGQVGLQLQACLQSVGQVITAGVPMTLTPMLSLDLTDHQNIRQVVDEVKPDIIVNAAAYTAVDKAESNIELATAINAIAVGILAEQAKKHGALLVHYSTDYVFNGNQKQPYRENMMTDPRSVYGETKLAGEQAISMVGCQHLILRTAWVYGLYGHNFLLTMQRLAQQHDELRVVADQFGSPTWSFTIAQVTSQLLSQWQSPLIQDKKSDLYGIYHLTSTGSTHWAAFAQAIMDNLPKPAKVTEITTADYPTPAQRPAYSVLDTRKLQQTFGIHLPDWRTALDVCLSLRQSKSQH